MIQCKLLNGVTPLFFEATSSGVEIFSPHAWQSSAGEVSLTVSNEAEQVVIPVTLPPTGATGGEPRAYSEGAQEDIPQSGGVYDLSMLNSKDTVREIISPRREGDSAVLRGNNPMPMLNKVVLSGIREIDERTFSQCPELQMVSLGHYQRIKKRAFAGCTKIKVIYIPDSIEVWGEVFLNCSGLRAIFVGRGASISYSSFTGCGNIEVVYTYSGNGTRISNSPWYNLFPSPKPQIIEL